jgi:hypothetical protein
MVARNSKGNVDFAGMIETSQPAIPPNGQPVHNPHGMVMQNPNGTIVNGNGGDGRQYNWGENADGAWNQNPLDPTYPDPFFTAVPIQTRGRKRK